MADSASFLKRFKIEITASGLDFAPRKVNLDALANMGISIPDAENIILGLSASNYVKGPESDYDGSLGEIWVYGTVIDSTGIYIKVKLDAGRAACISFHEAQHPLCFPLK